MKKSLIILTVLSSFAAGCASSEDDTDAIRSSATVMELNQVIQEVISPTNGDRVDWKMITVPAPGTLKMELVLVNKDDIFGAELKIYDRFGIPVKNQSVETTTTTSQKFMVMTAVLPEGGLHFVKVTAEGGETDYTLTASEFENASGFELVTEDAPSFTLDETLDNAGSGGGASDGGGAVKKDDKKTASKSNSKDDDDDDDSDKKKDKKKASSSDSGSGKAIVADLKGDYDKIEGKIIGVTAKGSGSQIRINIGSKNGVREGAVGDIYSGGSVIKGARFKVDKISGTSCVCSTNASAEELEGASKVVVKSPK